MKLASLPPQELRDSMRALPPRRRRAVLRAVREGRAVDDPRDAPLAVAWAQHAQSFRAPKWILPQTRPRGWSAVLWTTHVLVSIVLVVTVIAIPAWRLGGIAGWAIIGVMAYSLVTTPWIVSLSLRMKWNAPEAERRNRELLDAGCQTKR